MSLKSLPLAPPLPCPPGFNLDSILDFLLSVKVEDAPAAELENYCRGDWKRFLYTFGLARSLSGRALELGGNPYFTTMLLRLFTPLDVSVANYFGPECRVDAKGMGQQRVSFRNPASGADDSVVIPFHHFNSETVAFPFSDQTFDVVFYCEIIEHLTMDPVRVLQEIKRILKPGGQLILSTPNVARLENVARLLSGQNIYDPYSGYGIYGRHNREYTRHDLFRLLDHCGYDLADMFTADVSPNRTDDIFKLRDFEKLVAFRKLDLGQYIFLRSISSRPSRDRRPAWLYRSLPADQLE